MKWYDKTFAELTTKELLALLKLRAVVFNGEQKSSYPDPDDHDCRAHHVFAVKKDGTLVAYGRYFNLTGEVTFGRVVVAPTARGRGLGDAVINHLLQGIKQNYPGKKVVIHAQAYVERFYQQYGFTAIGDHFIEAGREHVTMVHPPLT